MNTLTIGSLIPFLLLRLAVAVGFVGLLAWLPTKFRFKPEVGFLITPIVSGILYVGWITLLALGESRVWFPDRKFAVDDRYFGIRSAIGAIVGLVVYTGVRFRESVSRSRSRGMVGLLLIFLGWLISAVGSEALVLLVLLRDLVLTGRFDPFFTLILLTNLALGISIIALIAVLSNRLFPKSWLGFLVVPLASSVLVTGCNPLVVLGSVVLNSIILSIIFNGKIIDTLPRYDHLVVQFYSLVFQLYSIPTVILGLIVGLMTHAGTFLWRSARHSRSRIVLGWLLVFLSAILLGLGLAAKTIALIIAFGN